MNMNIHIHIYIHMQRHIQKHTCEHARMHAHRQAPAAAKDYLCLNQGPLAGPVRTKLPLS